MNNTTNKKIKIRLSISVLWILIYSFEKVIYINTYLQKECSKKKSKLWRKYKRIR